VVIEVLGQPDRGARSIGRAVNEALAWTDATEAWLAVAWAKRSGLTRIETRVRALRSRRKRVRALIGIDQHGATEEGLRLALDLFSEVRVYHDSSPKRTFHPKFYVIEGNDRARVVTGSGNLTAGGLFENYEVAVAVDLDLTQEADVRFLDDLRAWWNRRWAEPGASVKLTNSTIARLIADPAVVVVPEAWGPPRGAGKSRPGKAGGSVFGPPVRGLASAPAGTARTAAVPEIDEADSVASPTVRPSVATSARGDDRRILAAGIPQDRWRQVGFNAVVADDFFDVRVNGELISAEAIDRRGRSKGTEMRRLINPPANENHRIELPEPEGRPRPATGTPIILVLELDRRQVRYMYLLPGDNGYRTVHREISRREAVGISRKPETKRVYMTLGELRSIWASCPLLVPPLPD
jgi:HKD family nuclease